MKKYLYYLIILFIPALLVSGCIKLVEGQNTSGQNAIDDLANAAMYGREAVIQGQSDIQIGLVMATFENTGWMAIFSGTIHKAIDESITVECYSAQNDADKQIELINQLIEKNVDGIIFTPVNSEKLSVAVDAAKAAGIPIVSVDRSVTDTTPDALIESDNIEIGRLAAEQMHLLSQGNQLNIFVLQGDLMTSAGYERDMGFVNQIQNYDNCKIVGSFQARWKADIGNKAIIEAFKSNPEINAVYLPSDAYTQGAIVALEVIGKLEPIGHPDHVIIVSVDGHPVGLENIRKQYLDIDVGQPLYTIGQTAMDICIRLASREEVNETVIRMLPQIISSQNVDSPDLWANIIR